MIIRVVWGSALLFAPASLAGQRLPPLPPYALGSALRSPSAADLGFAQTSTIPRTYWLEGGIIGAVPLALIGGVGFHSLCESGNCTRSTVGGALFGGAVGFTVGALVGGQFPKRGRATETPP